MNLALILLKTGQTLIADHEMLDYEPKVHLISPYEVTGKTKAVLSSWPAHANDQHILLRSEDLLTVCEPAEDIVKSYLKKVGKTEADLKTPERPVILNEEVQDQIPFDDDEDYEPRYIEEDVY